MVYLMTCTDLLLEQQRGKDYSPYIIETEPEEWLVVNDMLDDRLTDDRMKIRNEFLENPKLWSLYQRWNNISWSSKTEDDAIRESIKYIKLLKDIRNHYGGCEHKVYKADIKNFTTDDLSLEGSCQKCGRFAKRQLWTCHIDFPDYSYLFKFK